MSTKTMRPPPRRVPWPSPTGTGSNSNTSKDSHSINKTNANKRKERGDGSERPKKPNTTDPNPSPNPMTRLPKSDKLRAGSDPKASHTQKGSNPMSDTSNNNNTNGKGKNNEGSGSKGNNQLLAGYLAHEYLTKGTLLGRRWDQLPSQRAEPQPEGKYDRYVELASLLKTGGAHFSGVVNPTQLAQCLRLMK